MTRRRIIWISVGIILAVYIAAGGILIFRRTIPHFMTGYRALATGKSEVITNSTNARENFDTASTEFRASVEGLNSLPFWVQTLTPLPPFRWQVRLSKAAYYLAESGEIASALVADFPNVGEKQDLNTLLSGVSGGLSQWSSRNQIALENLRTNLSQAQTELDAVPSWVGFSKKQDIDTLQSTLRTINERFGDVHTILTRLPLAFGKNDARPHSWLILFQNESEIRPSGGFIGSYGLLNSSGGIIRQFQFGTDIYKIDKPFMQRTKITPPEYLKTIVPYWSFHDSNVGAGFRNDISPQIANLYYQTTGTSVDGIIFLDTTILEDFLRLTGPVTLPGTTTVVTADTVSGELTQHIEKDYFESPENVVEQEPKRVLAELIPVLLEKIQSTPNVMAKLIPLAGAAATRKSFQIWSTDEAFRSAIDRLQPEDTPATGNWIKIVHSNLGGLKSTRNVTQNVTITQKTDAKAKRIIQTVKITRTHEGTGLWPDGENRNYTDIYIPLQAEIISLPESKGGESQLSSPLKHLINWTDKEWKTEVRAETLWKKVSLWTTVSVNEQASFELSYSLPLEMEYENSLSYIKQAGSEREYLSALNFNGLVESNLFLAK